jgi:hypothetical protein
LEAYCLVEEIFCVSQSFLLILVQKDHGDITDDFMEYSRKEKRNAREGWKAIENWQES